MRLYSYFRSSAAYRVRIALNMPQVFNAERFESDLGPYPTLQRIARACAGLPAFARAHPGQHPDAA